MTQPKFSSLSQLLILISRNTPKLHKQSRNLTIFDIKPLFAGRYRMFRMHGPQWNNTRIILTDARYPAIDAFYLVGTGGN